MSLAAEDNILLFKFQTLCLNVQLIPAEGATCHEVILYAAKFPWRLD
jgi:hypothetical protein